MRVFVSAGEVSGDRILAAVLDRLAEAHPDLRVEGLGGPESARRGLRSLFPLERLALNGIGDVAKSALFCLRLYRTAVSRMHGFRPDLVLLVDYPGLNLRLLRQAVKRGYRVHYVSPPQWWAYRDEYVSRRMRRHGPYLKRASLQALYPFEAAPYAHAGMDISVGHFLPDSASAPSVRQTDKAGPGCLLLLPGSRPHVMRRNLPRWLRALPVPGQGEEPIPLILLLPEFLADEGRRHLAAVNLTGEVLTSREEAFARAGRALAFPGTVTLELALAGIPTAVVALVDSLTVWAAKRVLRPGPLALPNRILGSKVFPEWAGTPKAFGHEVLRELLSAVPSTQEMPEIRERLRRELGPGDGAMTAVKRCALKS